MVLPANTGNTGIGGGGVYPHIASRAKELRPEVEQKVMDMVSKMASDAVEQPQSLREREIKRLKDGFDTINTLLSKLPPGSSKYDAKIQAWIDDLAKGVCDSGLIGVNNILLAALEYPSAEELPGYLVRSYKQICIQEILAKDAFMNERQFNIHTPQGINFFIANKHEALGIDKEDPLYQAAAIDRNMSGVPLLIENYSSYHNVKDYLNHLVDKFSEYYTKDALIKYALNWINEKNAPEQETPRKPLRQDLSGLIMEQCDDVDFVVNACLEKSSEDPTKLLEYQFTEEGIKQLLKEELARMGETLSDVLAEVQKDGLTLENVGERWKKNETIVREAFKQNPDALRFADRGVALSLVAEDPARFRYIHPDLSGDKAFVTAALKKNPALFSVLPDSMQSDKSFLVELIEQVPACFAYIPESLPDDDPLVLDLFKAFAIGGEKWEKYLGKTEEPPTRYR